MTQNYVFTSDGDSHIEYDGFVVVDFGIDYLEDGDWMWVECENEQGEKHTYWKKRENESDNPVYQLNQYAW